MKQAVALLASPPTYAQQPRRAVRPVPRVVPGRPVLLEGGVDLAKVNRMARESRDYILSKTGWPTTRIR